MSEDLRKDAGISVVGPFAIIPDWVIRSKVRDRAVRLFALLARYANREMQAFPARGTLARELGVSVDSVDRALKELVRIGAVLTQPRFTDAGDRTSNRYTLMVGARSSPNGPAARERLASRTHTSTGGGAPTGTTAATMRHRTIASLTIPESSEEDSPSIDFTKPLMQAILIFPTSGAGPSEWKLTSDQLSDWQTAYPTLDVLGECRRAHVWLDANPTRRKTSLGMPGFLVSWLNRAIARRPMSLSATRAKNGLSPITESALRAIREARS